MTAGFFGEPGSCFFGRECVGESGAESFRAGVHEYGDLVPLGSWENALESRGHLSERSELCPLFSVLSSLPGA